MSDSLYSLEELTPDIPVKSRANRLISAAVELIAERGVAGVSARTLASSTGFSASAVNHIHGSMGQLLSRAFAVGVARTRAWLDETDKAVAALPVSPAGAVLALEYVIVAWTGGLRSTALLYQEALAWEDGKDVARAWTRLWRDYWISTASRFGMSEMDGRLMHLMFESEALYHLSQWSPALEAAALREHCGQFAGVFFSAPEPSIIGAAELAVKMSGAFPHGALPAAAARIAEAAAAVLHTGGLKRLTHRAVAARAGVTTGAVTHHFCTIDELIAGAVRGQVLAITREVKSSVEPDSTTALFAGIRQRILTKENEPSRHLHRGQLFLATLRRPDLAQAGAAIRFASGGTLTHILTRLFEMPPERGRLNAGVLSRLLGAIGHVCAVELDPHATAEVLLAQIEDRFEDALPIRII